MTNSGLLGVCAGRTEGAGFVVPDLSQSVRNGLKGMATIRKRGELQWQARVRRKGYPDQVKTLETRAEAEAWARKVESEIDRGVFVNRAEAEATSLHDLLARYEREIVPDKKGAAQERSVLRALRATDLAMRPVASVRGADVAKLRDDWIKTLKPATVLRRLAVLSHVLNIARKEWGMESLSNPVEFVRKPQPNNARSRRIATAEEEGGRPTDDGELERVIAASSSSILPAVIRLAVETAMRRGEIVALRWEYIDLKRQVAHLPVTKNGSPRDVPLSSRAIAVLHELKRVAEARVAERVGSEDAAKIAYLPSGPVFRIRSDAVTRAFERAVDRARRIYLEECEEAKRQPDAKYLVDLRFHDLRHEAASRLASVYQLHELTKVTGHKDPRMLMRYYHPKAEELAKRLG